MVWIIIRQFLMVTPYISTSFARCSVSHWRQSTFPCLIDVEFGHVIYFGQQNMVQGVGPSAAGWGFNKYPLFLLRLTYPFQGCMRRSVHSRELWVQKEWESRECINPIDNLGKILIKPSQLTAWSKFLKLTCRPLSKKYKFLLFSVFLK